MIKTWHICISGFTQNINRQTGFDKLWANLRELASPEVSTPLPIQWNGNFDGVADTIFRMSNVNGEEVAPRICVYAYSWGCGHGFLKLAKELRKRGADRFSINNAVLCDPIFHSLWRPWRAVMTGKWAIPIKIPDNVLHVDWFYQRQNRPQGSRLIRKTKQSLYPVFNSESELKYNHAFMDDAPEFHAKCLDVASI